MPSASLAWEGGPAGRHARSEWLLGLGPLTLAALFPVLVAVLRLQSCLANGWSGREPFYRMCYSDLANSMQLADLGRGLTAYLTGDIRIEQPPLSGALMALVGGFAGGGEVLSGQRWFMAFWVVLAFGLIVLMVTRARSIADHPGADPVMLALAPVTALTVLLSPDIVGVALATVGIWAWSNRRPALAGVAIGLGALARTYPVLVLVVIALFLLRADAVTAGDEESVGAARARDRKDFGRTFAAFAGTVVLGLVPFVGLTDTLATLVRSWWQAPAGLGALVYVPTLGQAAVAGPVASVLAMAGWILALVVGAYFITGARRRPTLAAGVLVVVAIVLVTGKSYPVQGALWLVPLVALAGLRWRDVLIWSAAEGAHFVALWLYVGGLDQPTKGLPAGWYFCFLVARLLAVCWLARQAWVDAPRISGEDSSTGTLGRLPTARDHTCGQLARVGDDAYPPVTEGP